jgi:hypothetical protein
MNFLITVKGVDVQKWGEKGAVEEKQRIKFYFLITTEV